MTVHIIMVNGPEQRNSMVERTIDICRPYVDDIHILQNGTSGKSSDKILQYTKYTSDEFIPFIDIFNVALEYIPENDWFLRLDSDECPNLQLLQFLKYEMNKLEIYNMMQILFKGHNISNDKYTYNQGYFETCRLFKKIPTIRTESAYTVHIGYNNHHPVIWRETRLKINHFKHDYAVLLSTVSNMVYSIDNKTKGFEHITDGEMWAINYIKSCFQNYTPATIYQTFEDKILWSNILNNIKMLKMSNTPYIVEIYDGIQFVVNCKQKLSELYQLPKCDGICCSYE